MNYFKELLGEHRVLDHVAKRLASTNKKQPLQTHILSYLQELPQKLSFTSFR
ncbi:hypothetical protein RV17_GL000851 [Enterococcus thailandicus]|uniref:hypothetical protein n=1 Tax=Enterococcus sp. DIV0180 TaxID=2774749 RepID=UPI00091CE8FB|nr:hypothetical protein RV17_GL000851 [Enterococcus thailandicus]